MSINFGTKTVFQYHEKTSVDKKDRKILFHLCKNARIPISLIAKQVGLSKDTIKYRIQRMEKSGLILGYTAVVNLTKLKYHWNIFLLQTKFESRAQEQLFLQHLQASPGVLKVMKCSGPWDYHIDVVYHSLMELQKLVKEIKEMAILLNFSVLSCLNEAKYSHIPPIFFEGVVDGTPSSTQQLPIGRVNEASDVSYECDSTDLSLIKMLSHNARLSLLELSASIGFSSDATHYRMKKLEQNGILCGYMPVINTAMLFDEYWIFVQRKSLSKNLLSFLIHNKNIQAVYEVGFEYDLFFWISAQTIGEYEKVLSEIKEKFGDDIIKLAPVVALREYKYTEFPGVEVEAVSSSM